MNNDSLTGLVEKARSGCRPSMNNLSVRVQDRLYTYIYRLTLNEHVAHDILQDTLLQMVRSIRDLNQADRFMPWLYKTAWGKVQNHFRSPKNKKHVSLDMAENMIDASDCRTPDGLETLVSREVAEALVRALGRLDAKQKNVLILRCFDNLPFSQIARVMNCTETSVRVTLFRARQNLRADLRQKGVVTKAMFLGLLGVFGQATSTSKAAVTVSASTLETGALAAFLGYLAWKTGTCLFGLLAVAGAVAAGVFILNSSHVSPLDRKSPIEDIKSFHFIEQAWQTTGMTNTNLLMGKSLSKGGYEKWFFFPEGVKGPMFMMMQRWDPSLQNRQCGWLLDGDGQKYHHSGDNIIYRVNAPLCRTSTLRFPCDSVEMAEFLDKVEGPQVGVQYKRDPETGFLVELFDNRFANAQNFSSDISYNVLDEKSFDSFRYKWPDARIIDERDEIHKLGWTVFEISGTVSSQPVRGRCQVPLVYNKAGEYPPLLKLQIGAEKILVDCPAGAYILNRTGTITAAYPSGTFFKAFMRPWFGIHTLDVIRRDAAHHRVPFVIEDLLYDESIEAARKRNVTLYDAPDCPDVKMSFLVNMEMNRIETIGFSRGDTDAGSLQFAYPTEPGELSAIVELPTMKKPLLLRQREPGTLWLFKLAEGTFRE